MLALYRESRDLKVRLSGDRRAVEALLEAAVLADGSDAVPRSLAALVQYRLGLLLLQSATTADEIEEAEQCLRAAASYRPLAPWAYPYVLACLHRLFLLDPSTGRGGRGATWQAARELARAHATADVEDEPVNLHAAAFNLLEIVALATGLPHAELPRGPEPDDPGATLLGHDLAPTPLPFSVAAEVASSLGRADAIVLELPPGRRQPRIRGGRGEWRRLGETPARLLAVLARGAPVSRRHLRRHLFDDDDSTATGDNFRQALHRLRVSLAGLGLGADLRDDDGSVTLALPIYAAVDNLRNAPDGA